MLAQGRTVDGERWALVRYTGPGDDIVVVEVCSWDGHPFWGTGCGLAEPPLPAPSVVTVGSDEAGPAVVLLQVRPDVRAAVLRLSDGTREDLVLHPLPGRADRIAVLVHPRHLDVHRIELYGADAALVG